MALKSNTLALRAVWGDRALKATLGLAALVCLAPGLAVVFGAITEPHAGADALGARLWTESLMGLFGLMLVGGGGAILLGGAAAWLVATRAFPGRDTFSWLLALPLALPAFVLAYAYGAMTGPGGPIPLRLSGSAGAAFVYAVGFYPYVYLATRAALETRSACALEAARSLGSTPWRAFLTVGLPLAWPGLAAGGALALMEVAADYGAAAYFGAPTLSTGLFRAWFSYGEPGLALQIAAAMIAAAALLLALERRARGERAFSGATSRHRPAARPALSSKAGWAASAFCAALVLLGAGAPALWLARLAGLDPALAFGRAWEPLTHSVTLAGLGALVTLIFATPLAVGARRSGGFVRMATLSAGAGYAAPGAALALGALAVFAATRDAGLISGLSGGVAITALIWTYAARFAGAGAQPIEAGLTRVAGSVGGAARTLGAGPLKRLFTIDLPIAGPSVAAAALIVFVEILRELPATLILRPFNYDTLAVKAHLAASDDRMIEAAGPALLLLLAGLGPMIALARRLSNKH